MELMDEMQARTLFFIASVNRGGFQPSRAQVSKWLESPQPRPGRRGNLIRPARPSNFLQHQFHVAEFSKMFNHTIRASLLPSLRLANLLTETPAEFEPDVPPEEHLDHMVRIEWIDEAAGGLQITQLGRALLRTVEAESEEASAADVVALGANNELAYPMLISRLAEAEGGLIVDPYIRAEQILTVLSHTTIERVLLSDRVNKADRAGIATLVTNYQSDRDFEVRTAPARTLHDRYIICDSFVNTVGTSLNTVGKQHSTIITPIPELVADGVRTQAEQWWSASTLLARCGPVAEPVLDSTHTEGIAGSAEEPGDGVQPDTVNPSVPDEPHLAEEPSDAPHREDPEE